MYWQEKDRKFYYSLKETGLLFVYGDIINHIKDNMEKMKQKSFKIY